MSVLRPGDSTGPLVWGYSMTYFSGLRTFLIGAVLAASSQAAMALTVNYDLFVTGADLGSSSQATLNVNQDGSDVVFSLLNNSVGHITAIGFTYGGTAPVAADLTNESVDNVAFFGDGFGLQGLGGPWGPFTFGVQFQRNNAGGGRLSTGETAIVRIADTSLGLFDFASLRTGIHIQGLSGNPDSTKYTPSVVPVPAALPLLAVGLGLLGVLGYRRRKPV